MKELAFLTTMLLFSINLNAQHDKVVIGEICYFSENQSGEILTLSTEAYTYHGRIELKFGDYQITIKEDDKSSLLSILNEFEAFDKKSQEENNNSPQPIDNYSPETISFTKKVIDPNKSIKIYYCKELRETRSSNGNLIIKIPELEDMFGGGEAAEKYLYFTKECMMNLREVLEGN